MSDSEDTTRDEVEALRARVRALEEEAARERARAERLERMLDRASGREAELARACAEQEPQVSERTAALRKGGTLLQDVIDNIPATVFIKDLEGRWLMVNRQGMKAIMGAQPIGKLDDELLPPNLAEEARASRERILATGEAFEVESAFPQADGVHTYLTLTFPIRDEEGRIHGIGGVATDITERKRAEAEREALHAQVIEAQRAAIRELGTPLIPLAEGVVAMPLVGGIDCARAEQIMEALLSGITTLQARVAILDLTGLRGVDTQVADALMRAARAVRLLGAEVMLTGIQPEIAQILVHLGVDMSGITTRSTLQAGVAAALRRR